MTTIKLGIVMDPIENIKPYKDTSFAFILEAQKRGWEVHYMLPTDLFLNDHQTFATSKKVEVMDDNDQWYKILSEQTIKLTDLDVILMRQDPPFTTNYIYTTYLLEHAERQGTLVINKPQSLRDANEKFFITYFPECIPPTLISSQKKQLKNFIEQHADVILKPLDGMGGQLIFRVDEADFNINVITELLTKNFTTPIIAQRYLPEIKQGDKRIILIDGEPVPHALVRMPAAGETRANLAAGGTAETRELTERDYWLCQQIAPVLKEKQLLFVGLDVIGDYITEINVTSPTCVRELDQLCGLDISKQFFDKITLLLN